MTIQLVLGVMNPLVMIAVATIIAAEKLLSRPAIVARVVGISTIIAGVTLICMIPLSFLIGSFQSLNVHLGTVIDFSLDFLVVFILTRTSFWRSLFAAAAYWGTLFLANLGLALLYAE